LRAAIQGIICHGDNFGAECTWHTGTLHPEGGKAAPLSSATSSNFSTKGMMARNYMFVQNSWLLQPGSRNKLKLPVPKVGKDGHHFLTKIVGMMDQIRSLL
jgi:hypothetical protein